MAREVLQCVGEGARCVHRLCHKTQAVFFGDAESMVHLGLIFFGIKEHADGIGGGDDPMQPLHLEIQGKVE